MIQRLSSCHAVALFQGTGTNRVILQLGNASANRVARGGNPPSSLHFSFVLEES